MIVCIFHSSGMFSNLKKTAMQKIYAYNKNKSEKKFFKLQNLLDANVPKNLSSGICGPL